MLGTVEKPKFKVAGFYLDARPLAALIAGAMRLLHGTLRVRIIDDGQSLTPPDTGGYIIAFWHNRLFVMPLLFKLCYKNRKGAVGITSASREGTLLTMVLEKFGVKTVRGSSSREGTTAGLGLVRALSEGFDAVITPDGPRGPRYRLNPGAVYLAMKSGRPILPIQVEITPCLRLGSWDRFMIPLPFSRVEFRSMPLFYFQPGEDPVHFEAQRAELEKSMQPKTL